MIKCRPPVHVVLWFHSLGLLGASSPSVFPPLGNTPPRLLLVGHMGAAMVLGASVDNGTTWLLAKTPRQRAMVGSLREAIEDKTIKSRWGPGR